MPVQAKKTALRVIMTGRAKDYYDRVEEDKLSFDDLVSKCYDYATKKRLDGKKNGSSPMDLDGLNEKEREQENSYW